MTRPSTYSTLFLGIMLLFLAAPLHGGVPVIVDTDMESDVDDIGAMAMVHALADAGEFDLLGVMVCAKNPWSTLCADRINTYFGRGNLPLGQLKGAGVDRTSAYAQKVAEEFPGKLASAADAPDAINQYRALLAGQEDASVVILSIGYTTNLRDLLNSGADAHSPLNGLELVTKKVRIWVCMGGQFLSGREANIRWDTAASVESVPAWPTPIIFAGWEVGNMDTGSQVLTLPATSPVRRAYQLFNRIPHKSWDLVAVLYAARGLDNGPSAAHWELSVPGTIVISPTDGSNTWAANAGGKHRYLIQKSTNAVIAAEIDPLMMHTPEVGELQGNTTPPGDPQFIASYLFEEESGSADPGNAILNHGTGGSILNLTNTGGPDGRNNNGGGGYGAEGYPGAGKAFNIPASGDGTLHTSKSTTGGGLLTSGNVLQSALQGDTGAFTYEALIRIASTSGEQNIIAHDGLDNSARGFLFRVKAGSLALYSGSGISEVLTTIPTSGAHAFVANEWFHVAVSYSGNASEAGNVKFYWTRVGQENGSANLIGTATLSADLSGNVSNPLGIGTTTRDAFRLEVNGTVDEVRLSGVARSADELVFQSGALPEPPALTQPVEPVRLIFDTDMDTDCDDAAALAMVHALHQRREIRLLGTMVSTRYAWAGPCTSAINRYFGRPDMPLGIPKLPGNVEAGDNRGSKYARQIAEEFPHNFPMAAGVPDMDAAADATVLYRQILTAQPDDSVVIVTVGYPTNIRYLLESTADSNSPLNGVELVRLKVKEWVAMGSRYPSDLDPSPWGNFKPDPTSTFNAVRDWPKMLTFTGGGTFAESVETGSVLDQLPADNPVRRVYELYFGGTVKSRHSADQIAVLVAARETGWPWQLVTEGHNQIFANGTHQWNVSPNNPNHRYISALQAGVAPAEVMSKLETLMLHVPVKDADKDGLPDSWEESNGLDPDSSNNDTDTSRDGTSDLMKYALGLDPRISDSAGLPRMEEEAGFLTLTANRNSDAGHLWFDVEVSGDLCNWYTGSDHVTILHDSPSLLKARDNISVGVAGCRFIRFKVSVPN